MGRAIDADALLKTLKFLANKKYNRELTTSYSNAYKDVMGFIKCAPTIEPTVSQHVESVGEDGSALKHGHWIDGNGNPVSWDDMNIGCPSDSCYCSECGDWLTASDEYPAKGYYCPNCGAKMDEVEDGKTD